MSDRIQERDEANRVLAELRLAYNAERRTLDDAECRLRAIIAVRHAPSQARAAVRDLTAALVGATTTATRALEAAAITVSPPRHHPAHPKADRSVPAAVRAWSAELVRLAELGAWARRTALDDTGVVLPKAVRVSNYAAKGPHIAGMDFGNQPADEPGGPRIGIDLMAAVDVIDAG